MAETKASKYTKEISSDFVKIGVKPTDGSDEDSVYVSELEGVLESVDSIMMQGRPVGKYLLTKEDGSQVAFLGSVILDDKLKLIEIGSDIRIEFVGSEKSSTAGHSPTKQFRVFIAE